ncbi:MAG: RDD family protein [Erythrobacter sp.]|uniref:RDD family protein n=1 Tax=Erythrobacter sp. TaxID=1042 RepID=UPI002633D8A9|nr:RDD family protein [Erythrobacter sp.]MDJ0979270.1 RDD family protein [Erythrobacter sp.]
MKPSAPLAASRSYIEGETKRSRAIVTPEGIAIPTVVASRSARVGALMLDLLILSLALFVFDLLLDLLAGGVWRGARTEPLGQTSAVLELLYVIGAIVGFAAWYAYFLAQELGPRGATLGKRILGIRVAARNGGRLTPEAVIARNLLRDVEIFYPIAFMFFTLRLSLMGEVSSGLLWAAMIWFLLFALFPFFNKDALRAGDIIAGTWVVEAPKTKLADAMSAQGAATIEGSSELTGVRYQFGEAELSVYGEHELQTLERMLRDGNDEALFAVHETICRKIGWDPGAGDERAFLEAFYTQLRARLENDMRFGKRKADKFS